MDDIIYWVGMATILIVIACALFIVIALLYIHLSTAFFCSFIVIKAQSRFPHNKVIKKKYRNRRFWKTRIYFYLIFNPKVTFELTGFEYKNQYYQMNLRGWIPKGRVHTYE